MANYYRGTLVPGRPSRVVRDFRLFGVGKRRDATQCVFSARETDGQGPTDRSRNAAVSPKNTGRRRHQEG